MPRDNPAPSAAPADRRRLLLAGIGLLGTSVFWGSAVPVNAVLLRWFDPFLLGGGRMALSALLLALFVAWREETPVWHWPIGLRRFLVLGFFMAGFNVLYTLSILWSNPITIAAISLAMPLTGALVARLMVGARLEPGFGLALALTIGGGALVVYGRPGFDTAALGLGIGEALLVVGMFSWGVFSIKAQQWLGHVSQARLTLIAATASSTVQAMVFFLMLALGIAWWPAANTPWDAWALVAYLAIFGASIANSLWNHGVSVLGLPISSLYVNLSAVFAVLIAIAFGFYPTWLQIVGGLIVMAGVLYMQLKKLRGGSR